MPRSPTPLFRKTLTGLSLSLILAACDAVGPGMPTGPEEPVRNDPAATPGTKPEDTLRVVKPPEPACTLELRMLFAPVMDAAGNPVDSAAVEVRGPDGIWIEVPLISPPRPGLNLVYTDQLLPLPRGDATRVTARFSKDGKRHLEEYLLREDGCHHDVHSAPDTVRTGW